MEHRSDEARGRTEDYNLRFGPEPLGASLGDAPGELAKPDGEAPAPC